MNYRFITRESNHEKYGKILNINLFDEKTCSYDCCYCGDGPTKHKTVGRKFLYSAAVFMDEINEYISKNSIPDYLWFSCKGEPTINLMFGRIIKAIKEEYPKIKIGSWTNGTLLSREDVRKELALCDVIYLDFDTVIESEFQKLNKPHHSLLIKKIMDEIRKFNNYFEGELWVHTVFVKDINDTKENIEGLTSFLSELNFDTFYVTLGKLDNGEYLSEEFRNQVKAIFRNQEYNLKIE